MEEDEVCMSLTGTELAMLRYVLYLQVIELEDTLKDRRIAHGHRAADHRYEKSIAAWEALRVKVEGVGS